ncbi:hypothetical protein AVEN_274484-1 [Araneus ventricosus]|uniref:Uncharacterized protein n=1 Tax=Araneus ventricosus TaxID=182803 RepID=A0A4Y2IJB7_ARAVE|nr:hypothetical protein AVEN_274484-1 [Araneus ventricosus]
MIQVCYIGELSSKWEGPYNSGKTEKTNDQQPLQTGTGNKVKPRLPSDSPYPKWIFPCITSCYSDRRQLDNLANRVVLSDRKYMVIRLRHPLE